MMKMIKPGVDENTLEYTTNLMPEAEICWRREQYEAKFAKTGRDVYLYKAEILQDILGISNDDAIKVHQHYLAKFGK